MGVRVDSSQGSGLLLQLVRFPQGCRRPRAGALCVCVPGLMWQQATCPSMAAFHSKDTTPGVEPRPHCNPETLSPDNHLEWVLRSQGGLQLPHLLAAT